MNFNSTPKTTSKENECSNIYLSDTPFPIGIGRHVVIKIGKISRKYTILRVARTLASCSFDILVKIYPEGPMTQLLDQLTIGSGVKMRGPFGQIFEYKANKFKTIVMLVAGTGLAPMYRIIETILENENDETRIKLLFSVKSIGDIFLRSKYENWETFWNFQVFYYFSTPSIAAPIPYGIKAIFKRLDLAELLEQCNKELFSNISSTSNLDQGTQFLICGTKSFEKDMINYLQQLNVKTDRIHVF